ncbi:capsule assembly Wzi family protein [Geomonas nitrogeniifigens]|uniref:Capsule assembly Wzi family protein n=1 Tax=Geomonas diazotrophica TaxID=2843197 RepID=A0ABX8JGX6_9BACT|nr:capsule assembly Wzi family protein [Geomonas nitrogeniifigens]QWV95937.1 capsule assembly Wzi family protein [Geomonas nitrogeniifigens]
MKLSKFIVVAACVVVLYPCLAFALSSPNIPLDSPVYSYLEKLSGFGLISSDVKGIRPLSQAEAARLAKEAEARVAAGGQPALAAELLDRLNELLPRELSYYGREDAAPTFDFAPVATARLRYVYVDGAPRSYFRAVHDPGNDGVFGIGSGLRPANPYPSPVQQRGTEGTPLFENNDGAVYRAGSNVDLRASGVLYFSSYASALVEPMLLWSEDADEARLRLNRGYVKLGGKGLELEVGRDENWLGPGYRGAITLTNNARNFDLVKLSSPELVKTKYLWDLKYSLIFSRFEKTVTDGLERQPFFFAGKLAMKPLDDLEFGINLGRQVGGPGVNNSLGDIVRGIVGGTSDDNSNTVAGFDLRLRLPWLRNTELYGELSGEDSASFWPIVESYVAGFYLPRLTESGRDDIRFEYFRGNRILYTNGTFPEGYLRYNMPIGHSQGGATQDFFLRYSHWFSVRNNLALEAFHTRRGDYGRVTVDASGRFDAAGAMQAIERKNALRATWTFPFSKEWNALLLYGQEWIHNYELRAGDTQMNRLLRAELSYRY